jgi:TonB family protein
MPETTDAAQVRANSSAGHLSVHFEGQHPVEVPFLFEQPQNRIAPAFIGSLIAHGAMLIVALLMVRYGSLVQSTQAFVPEPPNNQIIWLAQEGPGGGGGAGTGTGTGIGPGSGSGLGPGSGGGTGGGVYQPGSGVSDPRVIREVKPAYTSDAMRAKVQGIAWVSCVVRSDGLPSDCHIARSLDPTFGLDQEAVKAAMQWRFLPGKLKGEPVNVQVTIQMEFTLR